MTSIRAFKVQVSAYEYKSTARLCPLLPSSLLISRYWVLDSACVFPFTFHTLITTFSIFFSSLSLLDFLF
jgi:hypothetical protein